MASKVMTKDLPADTQYEPGFYYYQAITDEHAETKDGTMVVVHFPAKSESWVQYHEKADMAFYCVSGKTIFFVGKEKKPYVIEAGDFFYIPRGEIHTYINPSETEAMKGVMAFFGTGCSSPYKTGKVIVV